MEQIISIVDKVKMAWMQEHGTDADLIELRKYFNTCMTDAEEKEYYDKHWEGCDSYDPTPDPSDTEIDDIKAYHDDQMKAAMYKDTDPDLIEPELALYSDSRFKGGKKINLNSPFAEFAIYGNIDGLPF